MLIAERYQCAIHMPHLSLPITDQDHGFTRPAGFTVQEHMSMAGLMMRRSESQDAGNAACFLVLVDDSFVGVVIGSRVIVFSALVALARHVTVTAEMGTSTPPADDT